MNRRKKDRADDYHRVVEEVWRTRAVWHAGALFPSAREHNRHISTWTLCVAGRLPRINKHRLTTISSSIWPALVVPSHKLRSKSQSTYFTSTRDPT